MAIMHLSHLFNLGSGLAMPDFLMNIMSMIIKNFMELLMLEQEFHFDIRDGDLKWESKPNITTIPLEESI